MTERNYTPIHLHTELSLLDSTTKYQAYVERAKELGQRAIAFTEHGNIYNWVCKKLCCDKNGIKYIHGVEVYLTETHEEKVRDNYHTILLAKNYAGVQEINDLVSRSFEESHFYYKPRISFDEFLRISGNVIRTSACLASPLNRLEDSHPYYERLVKKYDFLEVQPHSSTDQMFFNEHLVCLSKKYGIPLIAGTDTHSLNPYKAECRRILQLEKHIEFSSEDEFDLTYKTREQLEAMFRSQGVLKEKQWMEALDNTNAIADMVEDFELDVSFKYPILYGSAEKDEEVFKQTIASKLEYKREHDIIPWYQENAFKEAIAEECRVFHKIEMSGFMLFMSEMVTWCKENGIPIGFNRGSCGGSRVAYVTDITDLNPEEWNTVFSRFCNEDRKEIGDIDIDVSPDDRDKVYDYIIRRFGQDRTAYILAIGTISEKGTIDSIGRALSYLWQKEHLVDVKPLKERLRIAKKEKNDKEVEHMSREIERVVKHNHAKEKENPYSLTRISGVKKEFDENPDATKEKYQDIFYYYEGLKDTAVSQSMHPAGIVASPVTLADNYGTFINDGKVILQIDMESVHEVSLVKYDILGLKNVQIIRDTYKMLGKPYPKSHEIDWNDQKVWKDMLKSPAGIFQMESSFAFQALKQFEPKSIFDMSLVTASIRPSGASYRNALLAHVPNKNPSKLIDDLLKENNGYLIYQEDVIAFLMNICGLSGSEADNIRRAIGRKQEDRLQEALPRILEGYCKKSDKSREEAEKEAKEFIRIIEDASSYMFGKNHSIGYCMIGYLCAYLRCYHPFEFITAYLNNANGEDDIRKGSDLARLSGIHIVSPKFGISKADYMYNKEKKVIAKGTASIKFMNQKVSDELYALRTEKYEDFMDVLKDMSSRTSINSRQTEILIKLDYFSEFGNAKELLKIVEVYHDLKQGMAKQISKNGLDEESARIVAAHSTDIKKDGSVGKNYMIQDMDGILHDFSKHIMSRKMSDFSFREKMEIQKEYLGYVDLTTNDRKDMYKLLLTEVIPLRKAGEEPWGYRVQTRSVCNGKTSSVNIRADIFEKQPVKEMDIIEVISIKQNKAGYYYIWKYNIIQ